MAEGKDQRGQVTPYLEAWRRERALTQRELAAKAGVARSTVISAEGGNPISLPNVRKLAEALGVTVRQLLREAPNGEDVSGKTMGAA